MTRIRRLPLCTYSGAVYLLLLKITKDLNTSLWVMDWQTNRKGSGGTAFLKPGLRIPPKRTSGLGFDQWSVRGIEDLDCSSVGRSRRRAQFSSYGPFSVSRFLVLGKLAKMLLNPIRKSRGILGRTVGSLSFSLLPPYPERTRRVMKV